MRRRSSRRRPRCVDTLRNRWFGPRYGPPWVRRRAMPRMKPLTPLVTSTMRRISPIRLSSTLAWRSNSRSILRAPFRRSAVSSGARSASARTEPTLTDNDQKHVAVNDRVEDVGAKVRAKRDTIDIHEDRVLAVMDDEAIANTTRHHVGIGTAIRDRDLWHQGARQDGRNKRTTRGGKSIDPSLPAVRGALHYLSSSPRPERSRTSRMAAPIIAKFVMAATVSHRQRWSK